MIIRKTLIFLCAILCANVLLAQTTFTKDGIKYKVTGDSKVEVTNEQGTISGAVTIPATVTNNNITYTVTSIGDNAFYYKSITSVTIPNSVTYIGISAFEYCQQLSSVTFEENSNLTNIDDAAFRYCYDLSSVTIPKSVNRIGGNAFYGCSSLSLVIIERGSALNKIWGSAFYQCTNLTYFTCLAETPPSLSWNVFSYTPGTKELTVPFGSNYPSNWGSTTWSKINHKINTGETKTLSTTFLITSDNKRAIINDGVLKIEQGGEIVNATNADVGGTIEIVSQSANEGNWNFFGAPFEDYKLEVIKPHETSDVAVCKYNYANCAWVDNDWATPETPMSKGEGAFAYHFYTGTMTFENLNCSLNNSDSTFTRTLGTFEGGTSEEGHWMALANPYPAKLSVSKFLADNPSIQGLATYKYANNNFQLVTSGDIKVTEGFFVNYSSEGSHTANFKKTQLTNYPTNAKSEIAPREFIELALVNGDESVKVYFAQNEEAEQEYDIYDANKMFATMGAAEPYFLTDGIALIKEEVKTLPYYATMNVRSEDNADMNFVLNKLPEGYAVSIIDGENVIDMAEGSVYSTQIAVGDNENRFKLLVKSAVGLAEVEELDVRITNSNRHVSLQTAEKNIAIEVYNTLGQKVYETKEHNFILKGVSAGVYMIKAYNHSGSKTAKIVVK